MSINYVRCLHDISQIIQHKLNIIYCRDCTNKSTICPHGICKLYCKFCSYEFKQPCQVFLCEHNTLKELCVECKVKTRIRNQVADPSKKITWQGKKLIIKID